jgi:cytosine deaminase
MGTQVIRNVRPLGAAAVDVVLDQAVIEATVPSRSAPAQLPVLLDGQGQLLLPALVESHVHFDKTLWGIPWQPNTAGPTRNDRIANEQRLLPGIDVPIAERAGPLIEHCIARGSLCFRSHVDAQTAFGLRHVEAMLALRETYRQVIDLQFVAFPQAGMLISPGTSDLMRAALELGVELRRRHRPRRHRSRSDRAPRSGVRDGDAMARASTSTCTIPASSAAGRSSASPMTQAAGLAGRVMISHAYCLGAFPPADLAPLADRLAALDISIMTCAPPHTTVPPVAWLRSRGVNVCSGSDGIRDAWSPMGDGDMLERAMLIALRFGWSKDDELAMAFDIVSAGGARALGIGSYGLAAGCRADFVLLPAENLAAAVVDRPSARTVISRGRVVARDGVYTGP